MAVNLSPPNPAELYPIAGVSLGVTEAGVRKAGRKDLTVLLIEPGASVAGVFTQNRFCAAPVQICREHLAQSAGVRAMLINTGNANAGTGEDGRQRGLRSCAALADKLKLSAVQILPFSTGVIMEPLPLDRIEAGLDAVLIQGFSCVAPCPADFNRDGGIDGSDVEAFFRAWESGVATADVNEDGGVDNGDVERFLFTWERGGC